MALAVLLGLGILAGVGEDDDAFYTWRCRTDPPTASGTEQECNGSVLGLPTNGAATLALVGLGFQVAAVAIRPSAAARQPAPSVSAGGTPAGYGQQQWPTAPPRG